MTQRMLKITLIGVGCQIVLALLCVFFPDFSKPLVVAMVTVAGITGTHSFARGFEDGMTKFKNGYDS